MDNVAQSIRDFVENALGVNPIEMAIQIASTLVLFLIVKFTFWKHITHYLETRRETMAAEYDKASTASRDAVLVRTQAESELQDIRLSAKDLYEEAKQRGELERQSIVANAKDEAGRLMKNAQLEIESEVEKARGEINNEIVTVATMMAEKIIGREIDPSKHKELIDEVTAEVAKA